MFARVNSSGVRARSWFVGLVLLYGAACQSAKAQEGFEGWNLEPGVGQAHLVMVVRVASISKVTMVEGAKTDVALREYRFQPIRRLKGIFQRDQLSMTATDLGLGGEDGSNAPPLKEGEYRLLILAQARGQTLGCVSAAPGATTFAERVPLLTGPDDPLVGVVDTLIQVADASSREERATLLLKRLEGVNGLAAVPLLTSLRQRADRAAADERTLRVLTRLLHDHSSAVREGAVDVLREVLATRIKPRESRELDGVANGLREILESDEPLTTIRASAVEALGHLLSLKSDFSWATGLLITQSANARTLRERAAAVAALSHISNSQASGAVLEALAKLPLDEQPAREAEYIRAAVRADASGAERVVLGRLQRSTQSRESLQSEMEWLGIMGSKESVPLLLAAANQPGLSQVDQQFIAWTLGRLKDDRAVPLLVSWMRGNNHQLKPFVLTALESLDSDLAAREARPLLKTEAILPYKLRLARLLARHQIADGYSLATEHLADEGNTTPATLILAALGDARTTKDLSAILEARPDRRWHVAALSGLAATGNAGARQQLREILSNDRNPLVVGAAEAAGIAGDPELIAPLAKLVASRNRQLSVTALIALQRYLAGVGTSPLGLAAAEAENIARRPAIPEMSAQTREAIVSAVSPILLDSYVDYESRQHALAIAKLLRGDSFGKLMADLSEVEMEGSALLIDAQLEARRLREPGK